VCARAYVGVVLSDGGPHVDQEVVHRGHLHLQVDVGFVDQARLVGRRQSLGEREQQD
jgi:hypothetical protein